MAQRVLYNNNGRADSVTLQPSSVDLGNVTNDLQIPKSIVTAKGDIITATANATPVRQGVGNNGQIIIADSNLTNGIGYKDPSFRNWVINGNMEVAQRGTSWTNPVTGTYTQDRFKEDFSVDGGTFPTIIVSQQSLTPGDLTGSKYFHRINVDGAGSSLGNNSYYRELHYIEHGTSKLCGLNKKITLSIKTRTSIANKKLGVAVVQHYGTGGSPSAQEVLINTGSGGKKWTMTSSFVETTATFTTNTLVGKTFGTNNDDALIIYIFYQWGSALDWIIGGTNIAETFVGAGNIDIAQVALYAGDVAYPFEPVPYDIELLRCMRYCQVLKRLNLVRAGLYTTNNIYFYYKLSIPLRINNATLKFIGTANTDYGISTLSAVQQADFTFTTDVTFKDCISINAIKNSHGLTDGIFYFFTSNGNIIIDADF